MAQVVKQILWQEFSWFAVYTMEKALFVRAGDEKL